MGSVKEDSFYQFLVKETKCLIFPYVPVETIFMPSFLILFVEKNAMQGM